MNKVLCHSSLMNNLIQAPDEHMIEHICLSFEISSCSDPALICGLHFLYGSLHFHASSRIQKRLSCRHFMLKVLDSMCHVIWMQSILQQFAFVVVQVTKQGKQNHLFLPYGLPLYK